MHLELDQNNSKYFPGPAPAYQEAFPLHKKAPSVAGDGCDMVA